MAKGTTDFARQTTEQAVQTTDWMRAAAFIRDSILFAEETLENTFDFAHKLVRMKEPQEFARIQTEFFSRQAQVLTGSGQRIMQDVNDVAKTALEGTSESSRRRSEAA